MIRNKIKNKHTTSQKTRGSLFFKHVEDKVKSISYSMNKKGSMKAGLANLPYSRKALKSLAETLKIHRSMVWLDPVNNRISIKKFDSQEKKSDS